jgi:hypothetical protein
MIVVGAAKTAEHYRLLLKAYNTAEAECEAIKDHLQAASQRYICVASFSMSKWRNQKRP